MARNEISTSSNSSGGATSTAPSNKPTIEVTADSTASGSVKSTSSSGLPASSTARAATHQSLDGSAGRSGKSAEACSASSDDGPGRDAALALVVCLDLGGSGVHLITHRLELGQCRLIEREQVVVDFCEDLTELGDAVCGGFDGVLDLVGSDPLGIIEECRELLEGGSQRLAS